MAHGLLIAAVALAALIVVAPASACSGDSSKATNNAIVSERLTPETVIPTLTAVPATHPPPLTDRSPESVDPSSIAAVVSDATAEAPAPSPQSPNTSNDPVKDLAAVRRIIDEYWAALNAYDVDHAISMLEIGYRAKEESLIRNDIGRMKLFRAKLGVSEETSPVLNDGGEYEAYLRIETPVDTRRVKMVFRRIQGQWWIVFSDEVE